MDKIGKMTGIVSCDAAKDIINIIHFPATNSIVEQRKGKHIKQHLLIQQLLSNKLNNRWSCVFDLTFQFSGKNLCDMIKIHHLRASNIVSLIFMPGNHQHSNDCFSYISHINIVDKTCTTRNINLVIILNIMTM